MSAFRPQRGADKPYNRPDRLNVNEQWVHDMAPGTKKDFNDAKPRLPATNSTGLSTKLQVSNLHYEVTPKDLTAIFGQIGTLVREPMIRYDRSGRSSGVAIISYESAEEATRAKKQFDGILAKGQPMEIEYDHGPPARGPPSRGGRRAASGSALINRIQRPPLKERLAADDSQINNSTGPGPVRSNQRRRGGGPNKERPASRKPKTAEDLDKELDAFMGDSDTAAVASTTDAQPAVEKLAVTGDVDMA